MGALVCGRTLLEVADGWQGRVPVVMGEGNRPFFGELSSEEVLLGDPTVCVQGDRVTHLMFPVVRGFFARPAKSWPPRAHDRGRRAPAPRLAGWGKACESGGHVRRVLSAQM